MRRQQFLVLVRYELLRLGGQIAQLCLFGVELLVDLADLQFQLCSRPGSQFIFQLIYAHVLLSAGELGLDAPAFFVFGHFLEGGLLVLQLGLAVF